MAGEIESKVDELMEDADVIADPSNMSAEDALEFYELVEDACSARIAGLKSDLKLDRG